MNYQALPLAVLLLILGWLLRDHSVNLKTSLGSAMIWNGILLIIGTVLVNWVA